MENFKIGTTVPEKIKASNLSEEEWESKLFQIKHLLQMIGRRDESIRYYQGLAAKSGLSESEFELKISNNLALRADFVAQLTVLFADFNVLIQPVSLEKLGRKAKEIPMPQAA
jgi:hypothetical protein